MYEPTLLEGLLKRDHVLVLSALLILFLLAALYTIYGIGMDMTALEMTAMTGMRDMPGMNAPGQWSLNLCYC